MEYEQPFKREPNMDIRIGTRVKAVVEGDVHSFIEKKEGKFIKIWLVSDYGTLGFVEAPVENVKKV